MKTVILAEKPSQAKAYAETFRQAKKQEGYYEISDPLFSGQVTITYGFGHLVEMVPPGEYEERWGKWSLENLPVFPNQFRYQVPKEKRKQFNIVKRELKEADTIIIATDSDREGELIAWSIIRQAQAFTKEKNYQRLWINSLEKEAIYNGFKQLKPGQEYFPKFKEAQARQHADWLIGMNGSPLYSLLLQKKGISGSFSLGRVQTPTLFMIFKLQEEIRCFKKEPYVEAEALITNNNGQFKGKTTPDKKFKTNEELIDYIQKLGAVIGKQEGTIVEINTKEKQIKSPLLFSLSSLQTKMNQLMKASAKSTLEAVQKLYESKLLSYPRTDTVHITENEHDYLLTHLEDYKRFLGTETATPEIRPKKRYVDASKVQEHHAIIPTKTVPTSAKFAKLTKLQQAVYLQVVKTTVAMFAENYKYNETTIITSVDRLKLKSVGKTPTQIGWQAILQGKEETKEKEPTLPKAEKGERVLVDLKAVQKETQPPKPYNEGSLITAMKTAGKTVDDEEAQRILKEVEGIGTEATRASIIENLKQKQYIETVNHSLVVTPKGITLCKAVAEEPLLSSAEMTARWESYLKKIGNNEGTPEIFLQNIKKFILHLLQDTPQKVAKTDLTEEMIANKETVAERTNTKLGKCPKCKKGDVHLYTKVATCSNKECDFKLWPIIAKKKLTKTVLKELLTKGKTSKAIKGFTGKKGKFDAFLILKEDFTVSFDFSWADSPKK